MVALLQYEIEATLFLCLRCLTMAFAGFYCRKYRRQLREGRSLRLSALHSHPTMETTSGVVYGMLCTDMSGGCMTLRLWQVT